MPNKQWREEQSKDPDISLMLKLIKSKELFTHKTLDSDRPGFRSMMRHRQQLIIRNGLLYKKAKNSANDNEGIQFVLPKTYRLQAIQVCHNGSGHLGQEGSLSLLRDRFYWPNLGEKIADHIKKCGGCLCFKCQSGRSPPKTTTGNTSIRTCPHGLFNY